MACTTILVGRKASNDGSTMIARNDDSPSGVFTAKRLAIVTPDRQPRHYRAKISGLKVELPDDPLQYTAMPNSDRREGVWAASGINAANVAMTATETITSNARVLGGDPLCSARGRPVGIGEEDLVVLVLPYIKSAREGVLRLGALLQRYGTYESNGIAFSDRDEIWWLETVGGHHFIARRVPDEAYVAMPNWFGLDRFDFADAYGAKKANLCSPDLRDFLAANSLGRDRDGRFDPRLAFGSHDDSDHCYNTPRAWYIERYLNPHTFAWDGDRARYTPEADDLPWCLVPENRITVEDVKYLLSSHFQGTPYDPYGKQGDAATRTAYRPIGVNRTSFLSLLQLRPVSEPRLVGVEWFTFGSNVFNAFVPFVTSGSRVPAYFGNTTARVSTGSFYWANRLLGALADAHFATTAIHIERYQNTVAWKSRGILNQLALTAGAAARLPAAIDEANAAVARMARAETDKALAKVLYEASMHMKNAYSRSDS